MISIFAQSQDLCGESPIWDEQTQTFCWVDIVKKKIHRHQMTIGQTNSWSTSDFPTAIAWRSSQPGLITAFANSIDFFDFDTGDTTHLCKTDPKEGNRNNEGKCDARGRFWVGSMQTNLNPDGTDREMDSNCGALFRVDRDGTTSRHSPHEIGLSNTMAWSPDNKIFYFGDTARNEIYAFDYDLDSGTVSNKRIHFEGYNRGAPDGSCIDSDGCLWNARFSGGCIVRITPNGKLDKVLELPVTNPTSCIFGGQDMRTLFITSARVGLEPQQLAGNDKEGAVLAFDTSVNGTSTEKFAG
jgi:sugar lactone lactonase YvrE